MIDTVEILKSKRVIKKDVEIAEKTGFSKPVVSNYLSGRVKASDNFISAFEKNYEIKVFDNKVFSSSDSRELPNPIATINLLVESNRVLADSGKIIAESQKKLVETNSELTGMLKKAISNPIANATPETPPISGAIVIGLLEVIADLGIGKGWKSKEEGLAVLGRKIYPEIAREKTKSKGSVSGGHK